MRRGLSDINMNLYFDKKPIMAITTGVRMAHVLVGLPKMRWK
jgi:hypothetical protein